MSDHEYGACERTWRFVCQHNGAQVVQQPIALPATTAAEIVEQIWQGVTPRTRVIFLSHITSATALCLPVAEICARARAAGILTVIDGAHAPGQIPLDLTAVGADFYTGNCHKWLLSPKGAGFLYVQPQHHALIEPLVVSWGWGDDPQPDLGNVLLNKLQWSGTYDPAAYLAVPAAIDFQQQRQWPAVRAACQRLVGAWLQGMHACTGYAPVYPDDAGFYVQMGLAELPPVADLPAFKRRLYEDYRVEMPCIAWGGRQFLRISVQGYNDAADIDTALSAISRLVQSDAERACPPQKI
jgi:isopenicillin-N epimerase